MATRFAFKLLKRIGTTGGMDSPVQSVAKAYLFRIEASAAFRWTAITTGAFDVKLATEDRSKLRLPFSLLKANVPTTPGGQESFRR